jgi:hypothetical protein
MRRCIVLGWVFLRIRRRFTGEFCLLFLCYLWAMLMCSVGSRISATSTSLSSTALIRLSVGAAQKDDSLTVKLG